MTEKFLVITGDADGDTSFVVKTRDELQRDLDQFAAYVESDGYNDRLMPKILDKIPENDTDPAYWPDEYWMMILPWKPVVPKPTEVVVKMELPRD